MDPTIAGHSLAATMPTLRVILPRILALYLASRLLLLLVAMFSMRFLTPEPLEQWDHLLFQLLCRWDCSWYLDIASHGYSSVSPTPEQAGMTSLAFYPVYPLLAGAVVTATGLFPHDALLLIANISFVAALVYIHQYAILLGLSAKAAMIVIGLICFVPQGFVFSVAYSEGTFLLLLAAALYHLRCGHYWRAGLAAALVSATRSPGILFLVFAITWLVQRFGLSNLAPWRHPERFIPVLLAPLGLFCFWTLSWSMTGDAFAQASTNRHGWSWQPGWPPTNLLTHLRTGGEALFWATSSLSVFAVSLLLLVRRWYAEFAFTTAVFALMWLSQTPNALLRYSIVLFPVWIALAATIEHRPILKTVVFAGFGLIGGCLVAAWTLGKLVAI